MGHISKEERTVCLWTTPRNCSTQFVILDHAPVLEIESEAVGRSFFEFELIELAVLIAVAVFFWIGAFYIFAFI
jgi:hypothetical protein